MFTAKKQVLARGCGQSVIVTIASYMIKLTCRPTNTVLHHYSGGFD